LQLQLQVAIATGLATGCNEYATGHAIALQLEGSNRATVLQLTCNLQLLLWPILAQVQPYGKKRAEFTSDHH
jgi:hypothetical protein